VQPVTVDNWWFWLGIFVLAVRAWETGRQLQSDELYAPDTVQRPRAWRSLVSIWAAFLAYEWVTQYQIISVYQYTAEFEHTVMMLVCAVVVGPLFIKWMSSPRWPRF
jgi:hypothetical protein